MDIAPASYLSALKSQTDDAEPFKILGLYVAKCVKVYDGDTVHLVMSISTNNVKFHRFTTRLYGINAAELKTKSQTEHDAGVAARDYLASLILNKAVLVECTGFDKYGRLLGTIYLPQDLPDEEDYILDKSVCLCVNNDMIAKGHAKEYYGSGEKAW